MATKSAQSEPEKAELVEELLDTVDGTLDRVRVLYEQYFLGMQKQPPSHLHTEVERRLRDLAQLQVRNTAQRYRLVTLQQKYGAYNAYWRRTLRQIENGTYARNLQKISREAARTGAEVPEEILAAMPKRMREQVRRDRDAALARAQRAGAARPAPEAEPELLTLADEPAGGARVEDLDDLDPAAFIRESTELRRSALARPDAKATEFTTDATLPEGRKLDPVKVEELTGSLGGLRMEDVRPVAEVALPADTRHSRFETFDGLAVDVTVATLGEGDAAERWATFAVSAEPTAGNDAAVKRAEALSGELQGWAFRLQPFLADQLAGSLDKLLAEPEPAS